MPEEINQEDAEFWAIVANLTHPAPEGDGDDLDEVPW